MDFRIGYRRPLRTATLLRKKRQRTRLWIGVVAAIAVAVTACTWEPGASGTAGATAAAAPTLQVALKTSAPAPASAARRIYPYSIVPGGVDSRADIAHRVASDKVVAQHYASFDVKKAHPVTVTTARAVHVSYRKGDKVYWTAKKVMLVPGETLLTDGASDIRGRCGNRISETAMLPVAPGEPTAAELDESMNVAHADEDAGLQYASFGLEDGNPAAFQRFNSFAFHTDPAPAPPYTRDGMPSVPAAVPNGMGLDPTRYLTVSSGPALAFGPPTSGSTTVPPAMPATPPVSVTNDTPPAPAAPVTPVTPVVPGQPAAPVTPVPEPLPHGEVPEPGTLWLVGAAFLAMLAMTRKRRRAG